MTINAVLEADLRSISAEARRRFPAVKDAAERGILKHADGSEEAVQLKVLQTVLTVLQSQLHPKDEESMAIILGICLRLAGSTRQLDCVHSTATATLRQAIALIFDRAASSEGLPVQCAPRQANRVWNTSEPGDISRIVMASRGRGGGGGEELETVVLKERVDDLSPAARMGLRLLEDLAALAAGQQAQWLHVPSLQRTFALEMLEYVVSHYATLFRRLTPYQQVLQHKLCALVMTSLRSTGSEEGDVGEPGYRRLVLRCVATLVRQHHAQLTTECEVFLLMLVKSVDQDLPLWHRILVLEVLRPGNSSIVEEMAVALAHVVQSVQVPESSEESLAAVAGMFSSKARAGVEWSMDFDWAGNAVVAASEAHAITLAVEGLLGIVFTIALLTDEAMDDSHPYSASPPKSPLAPRKQPDAQAVAQGGGAAATDGASGVGGRQGEEGASPVSPPSPRVPGKHAALLAESDSHAPSPGLTRGLLALLGGMQEEGDGSEWVKKGAQDDEDAESRGGSAEGRVRGALEELCVRMVDAVWKTVLDALSIILARSQGEAVILEILRAYQAFTQACGALDLVDPRDEFLASLCRFTLVASPSMSTMAPPGQPFDSDRFQMPSSPSSAYLSPMRSLDALLGTESRGDLLASTMGSAAAASAAALGQGVPVLTPKNMHALRTLFNVSHRLCAVLGPSWELVMETLAALDRTIHSPYATSQDVSASASTPSAGSRGSKELTGAPSSLQSDFSVLATLDAQLFQSTAHMDTAAVLALLAALRVVSNRALHSVTTGLGIAASGSSAAAAAAGTSAAAAAVASPLSTGALPSTLKMFAVERMLSVLSHNMHRMDLIWDAILLHLLELAVHESAGVRAVAVDAIDRAVMAALASPPLHRRSSTSSSSALTSATPTEEQKGEGACRTEGGEGGEEREGQKGEGEGEGRGEVALEEMVVGAVSSLWRDGRDAEVKAGALRILLHMLEVSPGHTCNRFHRAHFAAVLFLSHSNPTAVMGRDGLEQRHGEKLHSTWPTLLNLLRMVAATNDKDLVGLAFQSELVVVNDCLSSIPPHTLQLCVEVVGAFAGQVADVNISLTSVGLLWTMADFFARGLDHATTTHRTATFSTLLNQCDLPASSSTSSAAPPLSSASAATSLPSTAPAAAASALKLPASATPSTFTRIHRKPAHTDAGGAKRGEGAEGTDVGGAQGRGSGSGRMLDERSSALLLAVLCVMETRAKDGRPEVRNAAMRTLFQTVVSHGAKLPPASWRHCLWDLIFPLIDSVRSLAATASRDEAPGMEIGRQGGRSVMMLVHHSRNTAQKQWDETLVMALNGLARLIRAFFSLLHTMDNFREVWGALLQFVEEGVLTGSREVSSAAASTLQTIMLTHATKGSIPRHYWDSSMDAYELLLRDSTAPASAVAVRTRQKLVEDLGEVYSTAGLAFEDSDYLRLLACVDVMARCPVLPSEPPPLAGTLPQVQRTVLEVLPRLQPSAHAHLWPALLQQLLAYLPGGDRLLCPHCRVPPRFLSEATQRHAPKVALAGAAGGIDGTKGGSGADEGRGRGGGDDGGDESGAGSEEIGSQGGGVEGATQTANNGSSSRTTSFGLSLGGKVQLFAPAAVYVPTSGNPTGSFMLSYPVTASGALSPALQDRVVALLLELFLNAPPEAQDTVLPDLVAALGRCMLIRRTSPDLQLWRTAVATLSDILKHALPPDPPLTAHANHISPSDPQSPAHPSSPKHASSTHHHTKHQHEARKEVAKEGNGAVGGSSEGGRARQRMWQELAAVVEQFVLGTCGTALLPDLPSPAPQPSPAPPPGHSPRRSPRVGRGEGAGGSPRRRAAPGSGGGSGAGRAPEAGGASVPAGRGVGEAESSDWGTGSEGRGGGGAGSSGWAGEAGSTRGVSELLTREVVEADEMLEALFLDTLCTRVLTHCHDAPHKERERLVAVLDACAARTSALPLAAAAALPTHCARFSLACLSRLFMLAGQGRPEDTVASSSVAVGRLVLPRLVARCHAILHRFTADSLQAGSAAMPAVRLAEMLLLLQELVRLVLHPLVAAAVDVPIAPKASAEAHTTAQAAAAGDTLTRGELERPWERESAARRFVDSEGRQLGWQRAHLLLLYSPLCDLVFLRDADLSNLCAIIFRLIGNELGLLRQPTPHHYR
ncbi:unnamed protein product [Closterium sp. NIES-64]|nr:unnamed protein product [Closterium sp. NIES-64]